MDRPDRLNLRKRLRALEDRLAPRDEQRSLVSAETRRRISAIIALRRDGRLDAVEDEDEMISLFEEQGLLFEEARRAAASIIEMRGRNRDHG